MEYKIGEIFEYNGEWYQCLENNSHCCGCEYCDFGELGDCDIIACSSGERNDNKEVYFKKLENVGEPITVKGRTFQKLILDNCSCANCVFNFPNKGCYKNSYIDGPCPDDEIWVKIKQNKEDMEEKKQCGETKFRAIARAKEHLFQATNIAENKKELEVLDSFLLRCWQMGWLKQYEDTEEKKLKPFDLEAAKAGKPVCTRDGRKARIICFDYNGGRPIVALVTECDDEEEIPYKYHCDGSYNCQSIPSDKDLMMLPEKKEGWVNIYNRYSAELTSDGYFYFTKEEALSNIENDGTYVKTIKMSWEE